MMNFIVLEMIIQMIRKNSEPINANKYNNRHFGKRKPCKFQFV